MSFILSKEEMAKRPLDNKTFEKYATDIAEIYLDNNLSFEKKDAKVRKIGEAINDFDDMTLVAYRAIQINNQRGGDLSNGWFGYAWQGIAGWLA